MSNNDHDLNCLNIAELERIAHDKMDKQTRDYYNEGADSGSTLRENISAYEKYRIRPRVLRDVSQIDPSVNIFGHKNRTPFGVAPTAMQCLAHSDGEIGTAKACRDMNIAMGLSSFATKTLEEVAEASKPNPNVLQLYLFEDRDHSIKLIERAKKAGFKAVFLTVDTPFLGRRNLELRNKFKLPPHFKVANFAQDQEPALQDEAIDGEQSTPKRQPDTPKAGRIENGKWISPSGPVTFHSHAANPTLLVRSSEKDLVDYRGVWHAIVELSTILKFRYD